MAQQNIDFGAPNWNEKVNANLSDLYAGGEYSDSGWINCATLVNGAQNFTSQPVFRKVIDFKKFKLVIITGNITASSFAVGHNYVEFPAGYPVTGNSAIGLVSGGTGISYARWNISNDGTTLTLASKSLDTGAITNGQAETYLTNIIYISQ